MATSAEAKTTQTNSTQRSEATHRPEIAGLTITKHSLLIAGHRTSISLENAFWVALRQRAEGRHLSIAALVAEIDAGRGTANLSSAIRVYLFETLDGIRNNEGPHVS